MPPALTTASTLTCPHMAKIIATSKTPLLKMGGAPVLTSADVFVIAGCPFTLPGGKPSPCVTIEWVKTDLKATIQGAKTLSAASVGLCKSPEGVPQGPVIVQATQALGQTL
jgi:hypothetical protein